MSDQPASSNSFVKAFIPGLVVGFVVGAAVGVIVASTGGDIGKLTSSNKPIEHSAVDHDANRDGYPDDMVDEAQKQGEELIDEAGEVVDETKDAIEDQIPETEGDG